MANGLTWVMASARTQAAASLDGIGPSALGRVAARTGTPLAATLAAGWSALALAAALWPGLGTGDPDAHLPHGFAGDRLGFTLAQLVPLAAVLATPSLLARRRRPGPLTRPAAQAPPGLGR